MRNLAVHNVEESDHLRATTGTVEVPTKRDDDAALAPRARPRLFNSTSLSLHLTTSNLSSIFCTFLTIGPTGSYSDSSRNVSYDLPLMKAEIVDDEERLVGARARTKMYTEIQ